MARQSPFMSSAQFTYPSGYQQRDARYATNSAVEPAMVLNRRPSLLAGYHNHFGSPERTPLASYYPSLGPMSMGPHVDEHSKRSRYPTGGNLSVNSQLLPLSVDVKKEQQQVYQPQTEAISPTPDDPKNDTNIRDSTIIRNAISKLESEIDITMKKLHRAKLSQSEIKSQADRSAADEEENDDRDDLLRTNGSQTLIEKILHDNRKKAEDSQKVFNHMNNNIDLTIPLYQEANDLESIRRIQLQYMNQMKGRLKDFFKKKHGLTTNRTNVQSNKYDRIYQQWQKSIEKEEKTIANKDANTYRETFEKTFQELRKTREDKEKKQANPTDSSTSEPQVSINTNSIEQEQEIEEEKMRKSSVIPPILYDQWQRKHQYFNQNGLIKRDAAEFYKERTKMPYWSPEEKLIFIEKFTQSPKNFGYISSFLENKTTEQCVQFYYMTKKSENYKNLLRKQGQANRRKAKQTTMVTSSTTIETTLVTKMTSSNTIVSSMAQQMPDTDRSADRLENDVERREINSTDANEEKRSNKNRCQLLSCTTEKLGKKKNRKNRLRAFPSKWNELTKENREAIRHALQIPPNVQRCCTRCYEKLITQVRQRQTTNQEEDDDDEESSKIRSTSQKEGSSKHNDEWTETEIHAFAEALEKFPNDWTQIAKYVHRSEQSCRVFYQKYRKKNSLVDDEHNIDDDNGSISGSEETTRQLTIPTKSREMDEDNDDDHPQKANVNEDSNDSTHGMIIDDVDEQTSIVQEKKFIPTNLTTINSLVEKEISKTLHQSEKRSTNPNISPNKPSLTPSSNSTQPPPLVALSKSRSPPIPPQINKGSIMRGTPISPSNKPISIDTSSMQSHHYQNPRTDYPHHSSHVKSSKIPDQQQLYLQQQQQQQAAYLRHYSPNNFPSQHRSSSNNPPPPQTTNKSLAVDTSNNDTYETLRADFVTSRYLTTTATTHSPNHERQIRHPSEQRSPSSTNQPLLPPPTTIAPPSSNPSLSSSSHPHPSSQQQAVLLAASQMLASSGMYPQELLSSGLLPYPHYYGSMPGAPFYVDPRLMHDFTGATNNEQLKNLRSNRHHPHSPPDPSVYSSQSSKRHSHENIDHLRYPTSDYATPIWRTQNLSNNQQQQQQQIHSQLKSNENPLLKLNELSRHSARVISGTERDARSPDEFHHRINQSRPPIESPSAHFQRVEAHNHQKSSSHEKFNANLQFSDHSSDGNPSSYLRQTSHVHKPHGSHPHHHTSSSTNRSSLIPSSQISPHHGSGYMYHGSHHSPVGSNSTQHHSQPRSSHHTESIRYPKESISIQEFMKQSVNEFVASTNTDNKHLSTDLSSTDHSNPPLARLFQPAKPIDNADQPILIDDNEDSNPMREQSETTNRNDANAKNRANQEVSKSTMDSDTPERRRDSSIKKILSNQPLEKQEYVEINQKVQNSTVGAMKVHSNNESNNLERANSTGGRETTRSRGSITMRMLMGANGIYADGKAQPMTTNELANEQSKKRAASPDDKIQSLEYLIRGELVRECTALPKIDETPSIFQNRNSANRLSPIPQQRMLSKRMRASSKDESTSEQRQSSSSHSTHETSSNVRDPFALQSHSKNSHQSTPASSNTDRNWQSYVQQQYQQSLATRTSRPPTSSSGSITQGSPISPPTRITTDQQHYPSTANNQLINPRYAHYMNKNESQFSSSRKSPPISPPIDHSMKGKFDRRARQSLSSSSDTQHESSLPTNVDQTSNLKSPSPISSSVSPTISVSSTSAHSLKKRLISEYELDQQRNSPAMKSPTPPSTKPEANEEPNSEPTPTFPEQTTEESSNVDTAKETTVNPNDETESSS